jgi:hypothetical protein
MAAITDPVSELRATLRALKLGQMLHTLPERLTLARQQCPRRRSQPVPPHLQ